MTKTLTIAFCLTAACLTLSPASAQVYQWKDANGRTVVSDTPPPGNVKPQKSTGGTASAGNAPATGASAATAKTTAEKDMDFKKRQLEGKDKADKEAKEQAAAAENKENCERSKTSLAALESGQRIAITDAKGERSFMEDAQRQQELERARKSVTEFCK